MRNLAEDLAAGGVKATVMPANLGIINAASRLAAGLRSRGIGGIDVLVNNAGFGDYMEFTRAEPTKLVKDLCLNLSDPIWRQVELIAHLLTRTDAPAVKAKAESEDLMFALGQRSQRLWPQGFEP